MVKETDQNLRDMQDNTKQSNKLLGACVIKVPKRRVRMTWKSPSKITTEHFTTLEKNTDLRDTSLMNT